MGIPPTAEIGNLFLRQLRRMQQTPGFQQTCADQFRMRRRMENLRYSTEKRSALK